MKRKRFTVAGLVVLSLIMFQPNEACPPYLGFRDMGLSQVLATHGFVLGEILSLQPDSSLRMTKMMMRVYHWIGSPRTDTLVTVWKWGLQEQFNVGNSVDCSETIVVRRVYLVPLLRFNGSGSDSITMLFPHGPDVMDRLPASLVESEYRSNRARVITQVFETSAHAYGIALDRVDSVYVPASGSPLRVHIAITNESNDTLISPTRMWNDCRVELIRNQTTAATLYSRFPFYDVWWSVADTTGTSPQLPGEIRDSTIDLMNWFPTLHDTVLATGATQLRIIGFVNYALVDPESFDAPGLTNYSDTLVIDVGDPLGTEEEATLPRVARLYQNYPNPFNPRTTIHYDLPEKGLVSLKVFNILGEEISTIVNGFEGAGVKSVEFESSTLPSGLYMYRLMVTTASASITEAKKMLVIR